VNSFKKIFDQEEMGAFIDIKADIQLLSHLEEKKRNLKTYQLFIIFFKG